MKRQTIYAGMSALLMLAGACSHGRDALSDGDVRYITVAPTIGAMTATRTVSEGGVQRFAPGDSISVYAWTGSASAVPSGLVADNSVNTLGTDGRWTSEPPMLWKDMTSPHYFLGLYPSHAVTDFSADPYTLDVSDQEGSDLLSALNTEGLTATDTPVALVFNHLMAKLTVSLSFRNQWAEAPDVESVTATVRTAATVDYLSPSVTAAGDPKAVALPAVTSGSAGSYASVLVPQQGFTTISVRIGGRDYTFNSPRDIRLEGGKSTTVSLIVGRDRIEPGSISISDWQEGDTIEGGEAQAG